MPLASLSTGSILITALLSLYINLALGQDIQPTSLPSAIGFPGQPTTLAPTIGFLGQTEAPTIGVLGQTLAPVIADAAPIGQTEAPTIGVLGQTLAPVIADAAPKTTTESVNFKLPGGLQGAIVFEPEKKKKKKEKKGLSTEQEVAIYGALSTLGLLILFGIVVTIVRYFGARALGNSIAAGIEHFDQHYVGVDVHVQDLEVNAVRGVIMLNGLTVDNPPGYHSEYLAKIGHLCLDLDMGTLVTSLGKKVVVEEATLLNCDINIETKLTTSNIQEILAHLQGEHPSQNENEEADEAEKKQGFLSSCTRCSRDQRTIAVKPPAQGAEPQKKDPKAYEKLATEEGPDKALVTDGPDKALVTDLKAKPAEHDEAEVVLHKLQLEDISVKVSVHALGGRGGRTAIAPVKFEDLDKEMKTMGKHAGVAMILTLVLQSIQKSIVANALGQHAANAWGAKHVSEVNNNMEVQKKGAKGEVGHEIESPKKVAK